MLKYSAVIILLLSFLNNWATSFNVNAKFKEGNYLYEQENYVEAKNKYLKCIENDYFSKELYLNIGNSYFKMDSIPHAILYYEKGLKLSPEDANIKHNLNYVNSLINIQSSNNKGIQLNDMIYLFFGKGPDYWAYFSIIFMSITFSLLTLYFLSKKVILKKISFYSSIIIFSITLISIYFASVSQSKMNNTDYAIVFSPYIELKNKPSENASTRSELRDGNKVKILKEQNNWYEISYGEGMIGWIEKKHLKRI